MAGILVGIGALLWLYYVLLPLRARAIEEGHDRETLSDELRARKRAALVAILDIETERDAGKLSDEDFAALRGEYEGEAIAALHELDAEERHSPRMDLPEPDDALEVEIAALRAELICPACGTPRARGTKCTSCGAA